MNISSEHSHNVYIARNAYAVSERNMNEHKLDTYNPIAMQYIQDTGDSDDNDIVGAQEISLHAAGSRGHRGGLLDAMKTLCIYHTVT